MTKLEGLRKQAQESAAFRGHKLERFQYHYGPSYGRVRGGAACVRCGKRVQIDTTPEPNGIDVGGEALALGCTNS